MSRRAPQNTLLLALLCAPVAAAAQHAHPVTSAPETWCGWDAAAPKFVLFGDRRWDPNLRELPVYAVADLAPDPADLAVAVRDAAAAWDTVPCSGLRLRYAGALASLEQAPEPPWIAVGFSEGIVSGDRPLLAFTDVDDLDPDGYFRTAQVVLNAPDFAWVDDACAEGPDLRGVVAHELGHALGLAHSDRAASIMRSPVPAEQTWSLRLPLDDDRAALCALHPCAGDACPPAVPDAQCAPCLDDNDCGPDAWCDPAQNVCARLCGAPSACPDTACDPESAHTGCTQTCAVAGCPDPNLRTGTPCGAGCPSPVSWCDETSGRCAPGCSSDDECGTGQRCAGLAVTPAGTVQTCQPAPAPRDGGCGVAARPHNGLWLGLVVLARRRRNKPAHRG